MSANSNTESMAQQGEFRNRVPPSEPLTTKGHKPGVLVGNDAVPEFHAETHPPGTAPKEASFQPRPVGEIPGQAFNAAADESETRTSAADTLGGATSAQVDFGYGKPMSGMTSKEKHGVEKRDRNGLTGVGANDKNNVFDTARSKGADLPDGVEKGMRTGNYTGAEDKLPESAEHLAAERKVPARAYDYTQSNAGKHV